MTTLETPKAVAQGPPPLCGVLLVYIWAGSSCLHARALQVVLELLDVLCLFLQNRKYARRLQLPSSSGPGNAGEHADFQFCGQQPFRDSRAVEALTFEFT